MKGSLKNPKIFLLLLSLSLFIQSCGSKPSENTSSASNAQESVQIPVSFQQSENGTPSFNTNQTGLYLAAPGSVAVDSYVMSLANCTSGLTSSSVTAATVNVYKYDTNCILKLTSFVLHGVTYTPSTNFTTWLAGNTAVFTGSGNTAYLQVISQLSSPINVADVVSYNFQINNAGTNSSTLTVSSARTITAAGQDAPNFTLNSGDATFNNVISSGASTGAGVFTFKLTCTVSAMTVGANASYNSFCPTITAGGTIAGGASGVDIGVSTNFTYKLIADPNGNGSLTLSQAQSTFQAGGDSTVTLSTDILAGSTGFTTNQMTGPVTIATNQRMILVLQAKNTNPSYSSNPLYSSFQYFPITLPTINP